MNAKLVIQKFDRLIKVLDKSPVTPFARSLRRSMVRARRQIDSAKTREQRVAATSKLELIMIYGAPATCGAKTLSFIVKSPLTLLQRIRTGYSEGRTA